jgi:hypothetical protein
MLLILTLPAICCYSASKAQRESDMRLHAQSNENLIKIKKSDVIDYFNGKKPDKIEIQLVEKNALQTSPVLSDVLNHDNKGETTGTLAIKLSGDKVQYKLLLGRKFKKWENKMDYSIMLVNQTRKVWYKLDREEAGYFILVETDRKQIDME